MTNNYKMREVLIETLDIPEDEKKKLKELPLGSPEMVLLYLIFDRLNHTIHVSQNEPIEVYVTNN